MTRWIAAEKALIKADPALKPLIKVCGPCQLRPQRAEPYAALLRSIAHQQLHGKAAETIFNRFKALYGDNIPAPEDLLKTPMAKLRACGFSESKSLALRDVAAKTVEGVVPTRRQAARMSDEDLIKRITEVRGVGRWTVEMLLMFTLGRADVLPADDFGVREGFKVHYNKRKQPTPRELAGYGERWAPYRSVASWYMWRALELSRQRG